mgnify:CR=1 FL=1
MKALLLACLLFCVSPPAQAGPPQVLIGRGMIERAITEFYQSFPQPSIPAEQLEGYPGWLIPRLVEQDPAMSSTLDASALETSADELARMLADLDFAQYNTVITHLLTDYRNHPESRRAIRLVLSALPNHMGERMAEARLTQRWPFLKILDRTAHALILAESIGLGRGLWSGWQTAGAMMRGGQSLRFLRRFRVIVGEVAQGMRLRQPMMLAALGIGATEGAVEAFLIPMILNGFDTVPIDPAPLLEELDGEIVTENAATTVQLREQICSLSRASPVAPETQTQLRDDLRPLLLEAQFLREAAPHVAHSLRGRDQIELQLKVCLSRLPIEAPVPERRRRLP